MNHRKLNKVSLWNTSVDLELKAFLFELRKCVILEMQMKFKLNCFGRNLMLYMSVLSIHVFVFN